MDAMQVKTRCESSCGAGRRTWLTAIGLLGAVAAWADGQIGGVALLAAVWAAAQAVFIRAGIGNEVARANE